MIGRLVEGVLILAAIVFYAWMVMAYLFGRDVARQARKAYRWLAP